MCSIKAFHNPHANIKGYISRLTCLWKNTNSLHQIYNYSCYKLYLAELFWSIAHEIKPNVQDDQVKVNHILYHNNINWYTSPQCKDIHHCTLTGVTTNITLTVTLLSQDIICRSCDRNGHYYVKHIASSRTSSSKESKAKKKGTWFLSKNWKERIRNSNLTGNDLLLSLANTNTGITDNNK